MAAEPAARLVRIAIGIGSETRSVAFRLGMSSLRRDLRMGALSSQATIDECSPRYRLESGIFEGEVRYTTLRRHSQREKSFEKEGRKDMMNTFKTAAAAVIAGLLIGTASRPAWSGTHATEAATEASTIDAEVMPAQSKAGSLLASPSWLYASRADVTSRQDRTNCKVGHIYSRHDVVGDPEACIMGALNASFRGAP